MTDEQDIFDQAYDATLATLKVASRQPAFDIQTVTNQLNGLYKYEGLDWTGRGDFKQAEIAGTILAYEVFIKRYQSPS